jgi:hypothetical protein
MDQQTQLLLQHQMIGESDKRDKMSQRVELLAAILEIDMLKRRLDEQSLDQTKS